MIPISFDEFRVIAVFASLAQVQLCVKTLKLKICLPSRFFFLPQTLFAYDVRRMRSVWVSHVGMKTWTKTCTTRAWIPSSLISWYQKLSRHHKRSSSGLYNSKRPVRTAASICNPTVLRQIPKFWGWMFLCFSPSKGGGGHGSTWVGADPPERLEVWNS